MESRKKQKGKVHKERMAKHVTGEMKIYLPKS